MRTRSPHSPRAVVRRLRALCLAAALVAACPSASLSPRSHGSCVVAAVLDGDSIACRDGRRLRLLLVDAPELAQHPWGRRARDALAFAAPPGGRLDLEHDVEPRDGFGRHLVYAYAPDGLVNELIARRGYVVALVVEPNGRYAERIRRAVATARRARVGLWEDWAFACLPADFRAGRCR